MSQTQKKLAKINLTTQDPPVYPRIFTVETLVGDFITTGASPARAKSDQRIGAALHVVKRAVICPTTQALRARAVAACAIPKMLQGTQWTFPGARSMKKLRTNILTAIWGTNRSMRCAEVVTAVLNDH